MSRQPSAADTLRIAAMSTYTRWIIKEIPSLVAKGVITPQMAQRLLAYYTGPEIQQAARRRAEAAFNILGALLVGGGIILILAYNWSDFSRGTRAALAFTPLLAAQFLAARLLAKGENGPGRQEGAATFVMLALGACMAVVSQIYHLSDEVSSFIGVWMVLSLPLIYIFNATVPAMLYVIGVTSWVTYTCSIGANPNLFWLLAAAATPFMWRSAVERRLALTTAWLFWVTAICTPIALGALMDLQGYESGMLGYASLFAALYLAGRIWFGNAPTVGLQPMQVIGGSGLAIISLMATYGEWIKREIYTSDPVVYLVFAVVMVLLAVSIARKQYENTIFGSLPFVLLIGGQLPHSQVLLNIYVAAAALATLVAGFQKNRASRFNAGLLLLSALIACRFFDSEFGLVTRGLAFMAVGLAFTFANRVMSRRRQEAK